MKISLNAQNNLYHNNSEAKNVTFGIRIPKLEAEIDAFISRANNTSKDELQLIEMIKKFAKRIFKPTSFIGTGSQNEVYDMGKYVFKIPKYSNPMYLKDEKENPLYHTKKIIKNGDSLNLDSYYGDVLLQIGGLKILKNIGEHIPCGVPYILCGRITKDEIYAYYFKTYFEKVAKLPQSAFDKFAQDVEKIKYPYTIDFQNPNNTAITKDNKIVFTDDLLRYNKYDGENSTAKLLKIFMLDASLDIYTPVFQEHLNDARVLFKKIILAGEKAGLSLFDGHEDKLLIKDALYKCQIKISSNDFLKQIAEINKSNAQKEIKIQKIENYIDKILE